MNIQIFSDLHCDVSAVKPITIGHGVDVVAVAGDVSQGARNSFVALRQIVPERIPIVFVMGNHEFYHRFLEEELDAAKAIASDHNVHLLQDRVVRIGPVRFAGATTWTDYRLFGANNAAAAMIAARTGLNDHRLIGWKKEPWQRFRPQEALRLHAHSRGFLAETLAEPGPLVVLTHHAPHINSVADRYRSDILSAAFASDLSDLLLLPDRWAKTPYDHEPSEAERPSDVIWVHGHCHSSSDYLAGAVRVLANPHGYGSENAAFDPTLVVEVGR